MKKLLILLRKNHTQINQYKNILFYNYLITFTCIFIVVLFIFLPIGITPTDDKTIGIEKGAPKNPRLALKTMLSVIISMALTIIYAKFTI